MTRWDGAGGRGQGVARTLAGATAPLVDASRMRWRAAPGRRAGSRGFGPLLPTFGPALCIWGKPLRRPEGRPPTSGKPLRRPEGRPPTSRD
jgi:hypothetical protein